MTQGWKPPAVTHRFSSLFFLSVSCLFFDRFLTSAEETVSHYSLFGLIFTIFVKTLFNKFCLRLLLTKFFIALSYDSVL